jgi:hypothetical protein
MGFCRPISPPFLLLSGGMILFTSIWRGFPDCKRAFGFMLAHGGVGCDNDDILDTLDVMFHAFLFYLYVF